MFRSDRLSGEIVFMASSLESNEAFWHLPPHHPANTSIAVLQSAPLHPFSTPSCWDKHTHSMANKYTCTYRGTERNYLSYTGSKQRISKAHVSRCCLCICSLFGVLFGRISALSLNKEKKKLSYKNRTLSCVCVRACVCACVCVCVFFLPSPPEKPQDGETQGCKC